MICYTKVGMQAEHRPTGRTVFVGDTNLSRAKREASLMLRSLVMAKGQTPEPRPQIVRIYDMGSPVGPFICDANRKRLATGDDVAMVLDGNLDLIKSGTATGKGVDPMAVRDQRGSCGSTWSS
jgi:hypothetical protein